MKSDDYQKFTLTADGLSGVGSLMAKKLQNLIVGGIDWHGSLLDVGCDHGFFCWHGHFQHADPILGLDRGRPVKGVDTDLIELNQDTAKRLDIPVDFRHVNLGKQWPTYGVFHNVLCQSMYHHVFHQCQDHEAIWYWLRLHTSGVLWWEGALDSNDPVVRHDVADKQHYRSQLILGAASRYFHGAKVADSPVGGRVLYKMEPKGMEQSKQKAMVIQGAGGATGAFEHNNNFRMREIQNVLGFMPMAGSLNLKVDGLFDFSRRYFRAQIHDLKDRHTGLFGPWAPRWCRFYPLHINGMRAYGMRFEGERYPENFVELVSYAKLRDVLDLKTGEMVCLQRF